MALDNKQMKTLMFQAATIKPEQKLNFQSEEYTSETLNTALRDQLDQIGLPGGMTISANRELAFKLIAEVVDELLPKRVFDAMNQFAEIKNTANGDKLAFKKPRVGRERGRNFITQVSQAGLYEIFKLDRTSFDMPTTTYGAAVGMDYEEFLEGRINFSELIDVITEGYEEIIYKEILRHMVKLNSNTILPANNLRKEAGWDRRGFDSLIQISRAYGTPTIFCSYLFATDLIPADAGMMTDRMKEELDRNGILGNYRGTNVVILPHSFYNTSNTAEAVTLPLGMCWILPDYDKKPVKIAFEGKMETKEISNDDWSSEMHFYKKLGVLLMANPAICIYENTEWNDWPNLKGAIIKEKVGSVEPVYTRLV